MQDNHYHIFLLFFKRSKKTPGSFKAFSSVWLSMMINWMFSKYCMFPVKERLPSFHMLFLHTETHWSQGGPLLPAPHPGSAGVTEQGTVLCLLQAAPHSLFSCEHPSRSCVAHRRFYLDIDYVLAGSHVLPIMLMNEKLLPNIPPA